MLSFQPDAPAITPEVLRDVVARPTVRGYAGVPSAVASNYAALAAEPTGAALLFDLAGASRFLVGTAEELYEGSGGVFTTVSSATYSASTSPWRFAQFGQTALAINMLTPLQYSNTGAFTANATSPKAACMDTCEGFVLLGNVDDTGAGLVNNNLGGAGTGFGHQENRWWCSPYNVATGRWDISAATQCTSGLLSGSPGPITGVKRLGKNIIYYKEKAIHIGTYSQGREVWRFDEIPTVSGCANQEAIVSTDTHHFFPGYDDFYIFDGNRPQSIGQGIREHFFSTRLNKAYRHLIHGQLDYEHKCIWWFYPSSTSTVRDSVVIYNYQSNTWGACTFADIISGGGTPASTGTPVQAIMGGVTYADLGTLFTTYDSLPNIPYGSPFWQSGAPALAMFDGAYVLRSLVGSSLTGQLTTGYSGDENTVSVCTRVRPRWRTAPNSALLTPASLMVQGDNPNVGTARAIHNGRFDVLQAANWHRFQLQMTGDWEIESITPTLEAESEE